jgi:hypothetical protein
MDFSDNSSGRDSLGARPTPFSGKHGEWRIWNNQFIAYVMQHEAMHVLLGTADVPPWNEVIAVGAPHGSAYDDDGNLVRGVMDKETALARSKVRKLNNTIFAQLMLCAKDMTFFSALEKAKTVALPYGDAALAWANLQKRYAPTTITSEIELRQELSASKLGKQTPDDWMAEIEHIRQRLMDCPEAVPVTDREVIVKVLTDLPTEYRTIVTILEHQLVTGTLTIDNMTDHLRHEYKKVQKGLEIKIQNDKKDVAFVGGRYKGKCTNCGIQGHKAKDCRRGNNANNGYHTQNNSSRRPGRGRGGQNNDHGNGGRGGRRGQHESGQNNGPDSRISCNYCKKKGHKEAYCYKKQRDERDQANMAVPTQGNQNHSLNFDFSLVSIPVCGLIDQVHEAPTKPRDRPWSEYDLNSDQGLADFFDGFGIGELPGSSTEEEPPVDETLEKKGLPDFLEDVVLEVLPDEGLTPEVPRGLTEEETGVLDKKDPSDFFEDTVFEILPEDGLITEVPKGPTEVDEWVLDEKGLINYFGQDLKEKEKEALPVLGGAVEVVALVKGDSQREAKMVDFEMIGDSGTFGYLGQLPKSVGHRATPWAVGISTYLPSSRTSDFAFLQYWGYKIPSTLINFYPPPQYSSGDLLSLQWEGSLTKNPTNYKGFPREMDAHWFCLQAPYEPGAIDLFWIQIEITTLSDTAVRVTTQELRAHKNFPKRITLLTDVKSHVGPRDKLPILWHEFFERNKANAQEGHPRHGARTLQMKSVIGPYPGPRSFEDSARTHEISTFTVMYALGPIIGPRFSRLRRDNFATHFKLGETRVTYECSQRPLFHASSQIMDLGGIISQALLGAETILKYFWGPTGPTLCILDIRSYARSTKFLGVLRALLRAFWTSGPTHVLESVISRVLRFYVFYLKLGDVLARAPAIGREGTALSQAYEWYCGYARATTYLLFV